jgi:hypothetical protein
LIPELDPHNPDTHIVLREDDVISAGEARWFRKQLERIGGKNPHGQPNLKMIWGATHQDPMQVDKGIKYLDFIGKDGIQLGERRFIIEIWRSPEFLVRSGRYKVLSDSGTVKDFYFCKGCHAELAMSIDGPERCRSCGSVRNYLRQIREDGEGQLLCDFPAEGCYDYWLRLERANLTYHPPDDEILNIARALWAWELTPQNKRDELEQADREIARRQELEELRRPSGFVYTGAVPSHLIPRL